MARRVVLSGLVVSTVLLVPAVGAASTPGPAAALAPTPATGTIVDSHLGLPGGMTFVPTSQCGTTQPANYIHIAGPGAPGDGDGSVQLSVAAGGYAKLVIPLSGSSMSDLTNFTIETEQTTPAGGPTMSAFLNLYGDLTNTAGFHYRLSAKVTPGTSEFAGYNFLDNSMSWGQGANAAPGETLIGMGTYAQFLASSYNSNNPAALRSVELTLNNCTGTEAQSVFVDDLTVGVDNAATLYDFEAPEMPTLAPHLSVTHVVAGRKVSPSVAVSTDGSSLPGLQLSLLAKPAGTTKYKPVGSALTTNGSGVATAPAQTPKSSTTYRWFFANDGNYAQAVSAPSTVKVAPKDTLFLAKRAVVRGKPLNASGTATPTHKGTKVTLWGKKGKHKVKLATTKEHGHGFYNFVKVLKPGNYLIYVTTAKTPTNTAGKSASESFTVSK